MEAPRCISSQKFHHIASSWEPKVSKRPSPSYHQDEDDLYEDRGRGVVPSGFDLGDRSDFHYLHITPFAVGFSAVRPSSFRAVAPPICICLFLIFLSLRMYDTRIRSFHPFVLRVSCMAAVLKSNPFLLPWNPGLSRSF